MQASTFVWLATGFAAGSIPFGYLFARARGIDVRRSGSGNIGATNVARTAGRWLGLLTLLADAAKGALPTLAAWGSAPSSHLAPWVGVAAVLGHVFSPWLAFRGGKGVATAAGAMAIVAPECVTAAIVVFLAIVLRTGYVSLASVTSSLALPVLSLAWGRGWDVTLAAGVLATLITARHRDNLRRLAAGTEPRFRDSSRRNRREPH